MTATWTSSLRPSTTTRLPGTRTTEIRAITIHTISTAADGVRGICATDIDADGDLDIISGSYYDDTIAWYENDGNQNFTRQIISHAADGAQCVTAADMDGDGDIDVLSASSSRQQDCLVRERRQSSLYAPYNLAGRDGARSVCAADMDGDGDMDVFSASYDDSKIAWYENDGHEEFTEHVLSTSVAGRKRGYCHTIGHDGRRFCHHCYRVPRRLDNGFRPTSFRRLRSRRPPMGRQQ